MTNKYCTLVEEWLNVKICEYIHLHDTLWCGLNSNLLAYIVMCGRGQSVLVL